MNRVQHFPPAKTTTFNIGHENHERRHVLAGLLDRLLRRDGGNAANVDDLNAVELLLQSLPLATEPFGVAMNRIRNARRYLASSESGAARYELRLLATALKNAMAE